MNNTKPFYSAKYLLLFSMLFMTLLLAGTVIARKIVSIGWFNLPASTLLIVCSYALGDIITEVYGYAIMRQLIWFSILCGFVFSFTIQIAIHLPSPSYWHFQQEFNTVFSITLLFTLIGSIGILVGAFLNSYAVSKWKILLCGKRFWLRSLLASCVGETVHTLILYPIVFWSTVPSHDMPKLIVSGILYRIFCSTFATLPASIIVIWLKRAENIDTYDYNTNFNPFKLHSQLKSEE